MQSSNFDQIKKKKYYFLPGVATGEGVLAFAFVLLYHGVFGEVGKWNHDSFCPFPSRRVP